VSWSTYYFLEYRGHRLFRPVNSRSYCVITDVDKMNLVWLSAPPLIMILSCFHLTANFNLRYSGMVSMASQLITRHERITAFVQLNQRSNNSERNQIRTNETGSSKFKRKNQCDFTIFLSAYYFLYICPASLQVSFL
jgi:hypothetical protein